jgi:hypothetical protein
MVSGHRAGISLDLQAHVVGVELASMVSGHRDRKIGGRVAMINAVGWPQWCPATGTGTEGLTFDVTDQATLPQWCPATGDRNQDVLFDVSTEQGW